MDNPSANHPEKPSLTIRPESQADIPAIRRINLEAFGQPGEADLVDRIRARGAGTLSMVATLDGLVVGHIFFSPMTILGSDQKTPAVGLGPMAVLPEQQRRGIGSALVRHSLEVLREQGHKIVIVLGHLAYYPRFGFAPAIESGICWEHEVDPAYFMALALKPGALAGVQGVAQYIPEFNEV